MTEQLTGIEAVKRVRDSLGAAGLPRTSTLSGGEITGWTSEFGATGFSIRKNGSGVTWHMVVSGKPRLEYREFAEGRGGLEVELHEPINPDKLLEPIRKIFESQIFRGKNVTIHDVRCTGHSTLFDDDVHYEVTTDMPDWLSTSN